MNILQLKRAGMKPHDSRFIALFEEYERLKEQGEKVSYIVAILSSKFSVSERKVYDIVKRFAECCNPFAVESTQDRV